MIADDTGQHARTDDRRANGQAAADAEIHTRLGGEAVEDGITRGARAPSMPFVIDGSIRRRHLTLLHKGHRLLIPS